MELCTECGERPRKSRFSDICVRCYNRALYRKRYKRPPVPAIDRRDPVTYGNAHMRVRQARGPASDHPCAVCGNPATEWSYTPGDFWEQTGRIQRQSDRSWVLVRWSPNPASYEALCRADHIRKDKEAPNGE